MPGVTDEFRVKIQYQCSACKGPIFRAEARNRKDERHDVWFDYAGERVWVLEVGSNDRVQMVSRKAYTEHDLTCTARQTMKQQTGRAWKTTGNETA